MDGSEAKTREAEAVWLADPTPEHWRAYEDALRLEAATEEE